MKGITPKTMLMNKLCFLVKTVLLLTFHCTILVLQFPSIEINPFFDIPITEFPFQPPKTKP